MDQQNIRLPFSFMSDGWRPQAGFLPQQLSNQFIPHQLQPQQFPHTQLQQQQIQQQQLQQQQLQQQQLQQQQLQQQQLQQQQLQQQQTQQQRQQFMAMNGLLDQQPTTHSQLSPLSIEDASNSNANSSQDIFQQLGTIHVQNNGVKNKLSLGAESLSQTANSLNSESQNQIQPSMPQNTIQHNLMSSMQPLSSNPMNGFPSSSFSQLPPGFFVDALYQCNNMPQSTIMFQSVMGAQIPIAQYPNMQMNASMSSHMDFTNVAHTSMRGIANSIVIPGQSDPMFSNNGQSNYFDHRQTLVLPNSTIDTISMSSSSSDSGSEFEANGQADGLSISRRNELTMLRKLSRKKYNKLKRKNQVLTLQQQPEDTVSQASSSKNDVIEVFKNVDLHTFEKKMSSNDTKTQIFYKALIQRILYGKMSEEIDSQLRETLSDEDMITIEKIKNCDSETLNTLVNDFNNKQVLEPSTLATMEASSSKTPLAKKKSLNKIEKFLHCDAENESLLRERLLMQILQSNNSIRNDKDHQVPKKRFYMNPVELLMKEEGLLLNMIETKKNKSKKVDAKKLQSLKKKCSKYKSKLHILRTKSKLTDDFIHKGLKEMQELKAQMDQCLARIQDSKHRKNVYDQEIQSINPKSVAIENELKTLTEMVKTQKNYSTTTGEWDSSKFLKSPLNFHTSRCDIEFFRLCGFAFLRPSSSIKMFSEIKFCDRYEKMFRNTLQLPNRKFNSSQLEHFKFYRLSKGCKTGLFDDQWANSVNPHQVLCKFDMNAEQGCVNPNCIYQHRKDFTMTDEEKLVDVFSYFKKFRNELDYSRLIADPKSEMETFVQKVKLKYKLLDKLNDGEQTKKCEKAFKTIAKEGSLVETFVIRPFPLEVFKHSDMKKDCAFLRDWEYRFNFADETFMLKPWQYDLKNHEGISFSRRFFSNEQMYEREEILDILKLKDSIRTYRIIRMAYSFMIDKPECGLVSATDSGLLVLKRSFDSGVRNAEICSHYIRFYRQKLRINVEFDLRLRLVPLEVLCKAILKIAPHYDVWVLYLKSVDRLQEKVEVTDEIISIFMANHMLYESAKDTDNDTDDATHKTIAMQRSRDIVEIVLYRIHLYICEEDHGKGIAFFTNNFMVKDKGMLNCQLTSQDRVFLWLCFIHYAIFSTLPHECFDHRPRSPFRHLVKKEPFVFDFQFIQENQTVFMFNEITNMLYNALEKCCPKFDKDTGSCLAENCHCQALRHNLVELLSVQKNDIVIFKNFLKHNSDLSYIYLDKIFSITLRDPIDMNLLEESFTSCMPAEASIELVYMKNYLYAFYCNKFNLFSVAKSFLVKNLFLLFDGCDQFDGSKKLYDESQDEIYKKVFDTALVDQALQDDMDLKFVQLVSKVHPARLERSRNSVHFQLSYIFYTSLLIAGNPDYVDISQKSEALERCFQAFISTIEISKIDTKLIYFWIGYMSILLHLKDMGSEEHFCFVYEKLRVICGKFNRTNPNLVYHLVCHFARFIIKKERIDYFIEMSRFCTMNSSLIMMTLNLAYESQKEKCYTFLSELIQKGVRLNLFNFWSIAICLAIDRSDHHTAHRFFQLALLSMPFDKDLLKMMKQYEMAVGHDGHLNALQEHCK